MINRFGISLNQRSRDGDNIPETIDLDLEHQLVEDDEEDALESSTSIRDIPIVNKAKSNLYGIKHLQYHKCYNVKRIMTLLVVSELGKTGQT